MTAAVETLPSVLPEGGLDLYAELDRYQRWLIDQALIRTDGNRAQAAELLGINRTTLIEMVRRLDTETRLDVVAAQVAPLVAQFRGEGLREDQVCRRIQNVTGIHRFTVEKAIRRPRPLAKCKPEERRP